MRNQPKFLVLSNGLRDQVGHYFETSVSVADAARRFGFRPILATHVECRCDIFPDWIETHALFHTDYWMREPPLVQDPEARPSWVRSAYQRAWRASQRAMRLAERSAYFLLPPLVYDLGRLLRYGCLPRIIDPAIRSRAAAKLHHVVLRRRYGADAPLVEQVAAWPNVKRAVADPQVSGKLMEAGRKLIPLGLARELEYALIYYRDLETFLSLTSAGPDDHVFLGTAHAREVLAIRLAVERLGPRSPTFHLEFRHAPFERDAASHQPIESPQTQMERHFLALHARWEATTRIRFYTDSERLSRDYETIADVPFGVLPLPFRAELLTSKPRRAGDPVTLVYLGEARDEKGFHWLPNLIDALTDDYLVPGKARLLIQSNVGQPQHNPRTVAALRRLRAQSLAGVELRSDDALSPADYYRLASQADVMLLPYLRERYRACTSGVLAEALATGAAAVVPAGTWMADQLPDGCGETFADLDGFVDAVRRVIDGFPSYYAAAQANQSDWRRRHSPDALVARLLGRNAVTSKAA